MKLREQYTCPLELTHDLIRGKWKPIILWQLSKGGSSLAALERSIEGINRKMLIEQLAALVACGAVSKTCFEGYPKKVEYALTARGNKLLEAISILQRVGIELMLEDGREIFLREKGLL